MLRTCGALIYLTLIMLIVMTTLLTVLHYASICSMLRASQARETMPRPIVYHGLMKEFLIRQDHAKSAWEVVSCPGLLGSEHKTIYGNITTIASAVFSTMLHYLTFTVSIV